MKKERNNLGIEREDKKQNKIYQPAPHKHADQGDQHRTETRTPSETQRRETNNDKKLKITNTPGKSTPESYTRQVETH